MEKEDKKKNFLSKCLYTIIVLGAILGAVLWINDQFKNVRNDILNMRTDMAFMKAYIQMKNITLEELPEFEREKE